MSVNIIKSGITYASGGTIGNNILINTDFHSTYQQTTGWNTSKNGTTLASSWGGYNSGVSNASTAYHAHLKLFQGEWVYEYIKESETWLGVSQGGLQNSISANKTYTWSIDEYRPSGSNNYTTAGVYFKKTSDGSWGFHAGCPRGTYENVYDKWVRKYYTFTMPSEVYNAAGMIFYIYGYGGTGTVYMRRPKLELGSVATPWNMAISEGNDSTYHGFAESPTDRVKIYPAFIGANNIIEI